MVHGDEVRAFVLTDVNDLDHVGVVEAGERARLLLQHFHELCAIRQVGPKYLYGRGFA